MHPEIEPQVLFHEMIQELSKKMHLDAVILFGSRATGEWTEESDYDLAIIGDFKENLFERTRIVLRLKPRVPVDVFCFMPDEFEHAFQAFDLTAIDVVGEGIVLLGDAFMSKYKDRHKNLVRSGMRKRKAVLILPDQE
jgi:predicted nucleotidyltransferase